MKTFAERWDEFNAYFYAIPPENVEIGDCLSAVVNECGVQVIMDRGRINWVNLNWDEWDALVKLVTAKH